MKPRKAQVKDKGSGVKTGDLGLMAFRFLVISPKTCIGYQNCNDKPYRVEKTKQFTDLLHDELKIRGKLTRLKEKLQTRSDRLI